MRKLKVYVAGPITKGGTLQNIRNGIIVGNELREMGFRQVLTRR